MNKQAFGKWGEQQAMFFLRTKAYHIRHTNWRCRKAEIDIIAQKGNFVVFVEVKTRRKPSYNSLEELITDKKIELFHSVGADYLEAEKLDLELRCDVIFVCGNPKYFKINHIEDAF